MPRAIAAPATAAAAAGMNTSPTPPMVRVASASWSWTPNELSVDENRKRKATTTTAPVVIVTILQAASRRTTPRSIHPASFTVGGGGVDAQTDGSGLMTATLTGKAGPVLISAGLDNDSSVTLYTVGRFQAPVSGTASP